MSQFRRIFSNSFNEILSNFILLSENTIEIDYVVSKGNAVIAIEVKSSNNTKVKSLSAYK